MSEIISVSTLNDRIKNLLEEELSFVRIEGEVSNLRRPPSGHVYFTLKDAKSQIRAVIFKNPYGAGKNGLSGFAVEEGMSIVCLARVTVYPPRGEYQLIIETVEPRGLGALQKAFEQLKTRLAAEGLFAAERKKRLPFLPGRIGVITSPSGAVIRDILTVTRRRFPSVDILIAPTRVQGAEAPAEIIKAFGYLQLFEDIDVIIIARGGGSLEDLAPFNDERVARAIAASRIPVISAVGHETDFTIADFTADLRAATPSAAAELAVPRRDELLDAVAELRGRLAQRLRRQITQRRESAASLQQRLRDPQRRLIDARLTLDDYSERIKLAAIRQREMKSRELAGLALRLNYQDPRSIIEGKRTVLRERGRLLQTAWEKLFSLQKNRAAGTSAVLASLDPNAVLKRGYSIARRLPDGRIIRRAADAAIGQEIEILVAEGKLGAKVISSQNSSKDDEY
ncbi:MAG: exodeoxyribonuclease VII large subunit [Syntrophales bacterium]